MQFGKAVIRAALCENRIMRKVLSTLVLLTPVSAFAQATVTIHVIDKDGYAIERCHVDRFEGRRHGDMASHFNGTVGTNIPYDIYTFTLKRASSVLGTAEVFSREVLVTVPASRGEMEAGMSADIAMPAGYLMRGRIEPMPPEKSVIDPIWIRLSPIHGDRKIDISVDPSGEFRIYQWLYGRYVLSVIQGNDVLHVQPITFNFGTRPWFVVKLPDQPPAVITVQEEKRN